jgi:hypothetical protein
VSSGFFNSAKTDSGAFNKSNDESGFGLELLTRRAVPVAVL